jgi:hypothetical protein
MQNSLTRCDLVFSGRFPSHWPVFGSGYALLVSVVKSLDNLVSFCPALDQLCGYVPIDGGESTFPLDR